MTTITYADAEDVVCAWVKTLTLPTNPKIFLQPEGNPLPRIQLSRVGGAPNVHSDISEDVARISFSIYANSRPQVKAIKKVLVSEILSLAYTDPIITTQGVIAAAEIVSDVWLPDPASDVPRYIVDARFIVIPLGV